MKNCLVALVFIAGIFYSTQTHAQVILHPHDDTLIKSLVHQKYELDISNAEDRGNYITETRSKTKRRVKIKNGLLQTDEIWMDEDNLQESRWDGKGRLYRIAPYTKEVDNDTIAIFRINGIVHLFEKGKLTISAYYEMGIFKYLLFYSNNKQKQHFLNGSRDDISRFSISKIKAKTL